MAQLYPLGEPGGVPRVVGPSPAAGTTYPQAYAQYWWRYRTCRMGDAYGRLGDGPERRRPIVSQQYEEQGTPRKITTGERPERTPREETQDPQAAMRQDAARAEESPESVTVSDSATTSGMGPQGAGHGRHSGKRG